MRSGKTGGTSAVERGERGTKRDQKKNFNFFHCTCPSAVNSLHICTCSARALVHGITDLGDGEGGGVYVTLMV
jgi:hypothetical protein